MKKLNYNDSFTNDYQQCYFDEHTRKINEIVELINYWQDTGALPYKNNNCSRCNNNGCPACDTASRGSKYNPEPY